MSRLIDRILENAPRDYFSDTEIKIWFPGTTASRHNLISRAIASGAITKIRRGLYALHRRYQRYGVSLYELAPQIYGPSYLSFESALSYHGLIPEAVYTTCSATYSN